MQNSIFHHITGNHPTREITREEAIERNEPGFLVWWQQGFEQYQIAVWGDGLCESDACEAAEEFMNELNKEADGVRKLSLSEI